MNAANMKTYHVEFCENGNNKCQPFPANNPGQAFFKCKKAHPKAVLRCCTLQGSGFMKQTWTSYAAPANQDMPPQQDGAVEDTMTFAFYPQTLSRRK
jgi:hypothetical protein